MAGAPDERPKPAAVRAFLIERGIDPDDPFALMAAVVARGWVFRLGGVQGRRAHCFAEVAVPGLDIGAWATCHAESPAQALAGALVLALASPPPRPPAKAPGPAA